MAAKLGYYAEKRDILNKLHNLLKSYYYPQYRPDNIEFKIHIEKINGEYFKIINKVSNMGSPSSQRRYKSIMIEIFKYMLPTDAYTVAGEKNEFLKVTNIDPAFITKQFNDLPYKKKSLKFKDVIVYYGTMNIVDYNKYLQQKLKVDVTDKFTDQNSFINAINL